MLSLLTYRRMSTPALLQPWLKRHPKPIAVGTLSVGNIISPTGTELVALAHKTVIVNRPRTKGNTRLTLHGLFTRHTGKRKFTHIMHTEMPTIWLGPNITHYGAGRLVRSDASAVYGTQLNARCANPDTRAIWLVQKL